MNKSIVIIISTLWFFCITYMTIARVYDLPYRVYAMAGSWLASLLLLVCVIIYMKKHREKKKQELG